MGWARTSQIEGLTGSTGPGLWGGDTFGDSNGHGLHPIPAKSPTFPRAEWLGERRQRQNAVDPLGFAHVSVCVYFTGDENVGMLVDDFKPLGPNPSPAVL